MDAPDYAGKYPPLKQFVPDFNLLRRESADDPEPWPLWKQLDGLAFSRPLAFAELVKAIAKGNKSIENSLLRSWGIR